MADSAEQTDGAFAEAPDEAGLARRGMKSASAFRTISEVATDLDVPQHVLRFWETKFSQIRPLKRGGGRRYYRPEDVELLRAIRALLYGDGYTIKGVQKLLRDGGLKPGRAPAEPHVVPAAPPRVVEAPRSDMPKPDISKSDLPKSDTPKPQVAGAPARGLDADSKAALRALLDELSALRALLRK